jgi:hypothetical protein
MAYGDQPDKAYVQDHGSSLYRRGLYTYWKRSIHYPAFAMFDAPNREVCVARRPVTNTPLQALVLLNDVTYAEAARVFAQLVLQAGGNTFDERLDFAVHRALGRSATARECEIIHKLYEELRATYQQQQDQAELVVNVGEYPRPQSLNVVEHAAWTNLCQMLLNLDETVTKE